MIDFLKQFKAPSSEYYPAINWVWNSVITKEGIVRQVDEFKKAGFLAVLIMTEPKEFRPKSMATNLEPEYLSDEFFSLVRFAKSNKYTNKSIIIGRIITNKTSDCPLLFI